MKDKFTTRELQDFFYSVWSTSAFKEQRRRAERKYDSICRAKEAAEAKEKARKAAEKKKEEKEKRREEKERAKLEQSGTKGLSAIAEGSKYELESKSYGSGDGQDDPTLRDSNDLREAVHSEAGHPLQCVGDMIEAKPPVTPACATAFESFSGPVSKQAGVMSSFVPKAEL